MPLTPYNPEAGEIEHHESSASTKHNDNPTSTDPPLSSILTEYDGNSSSIEHDNCSASTEHDDSPGSAGHYERSASTEHDDRRTLRPEQINDHAQQTIHVGSFVLSHHHAVLGIIENYSARSQALDKSRGTAFPAGLRTTSFLSNTGWRPGLLQATAIRVDRSAELLSKDHYDQDEVDLPSNAGFRRKTYQDIYLDEYTQSMACGGELNERKMTVSPHVQNAYGKEEDSLSARACGEEEPHYMRETRRIYMRDIDIKPSSNTSGTIYKPSNALSISVPVDPLHKIRKLSGSLQQVMCRAPPAVIGSNFNSSSIINGPRRSIASTSNTSNTTLPSWLASGMAGLPQNVTLAPGTAFRLALVDPTLPHASIDIPSIKALIPVGPYGEGHRLHRSAAEEQNAKGLRENVDGVSSTENTASSAILGQMNVVAEITKTVQKSLGHRREKMGITFASEAKKRATDPTAGVGSSELKEKRKFHDSEETYPPTHKKQSRLKPEPEEGKVSPSAETTVSNRWRPSQPKEKAQPEDLHKTNLLSHVRKGKCRCQVHSRSLRLRQLCESGELRRTTTSQPSSTYEKRKREEPEDKESPDQKRHRQWR